MSVVVNIRNKNVPRNATEPPREDNVADALESVKLALYRLRDTGQRVRTKYGNTASLDMIDSFTNQGYEAVVKISRGFNGY